MILLDTNVISELMRPRPDEHVVAWINHQVTATLYVSTVTVAEIEYGLEILPDGGRRQDLERRFKRFISEGFEQRVLAFDSGAAHEYASILGHRRALGRPMAARDGQIASIAAANELALATRNLGDFTDCGLQLVNPFHAGTAESE
jgi:hypothetical protein